MSSVRDNAPIGVFDSGVGGLTVAREIMRQLPDESMIYFGDTARVPYGTKSKDTVIRYSRQIVNFLLSKNVKAIVIACNTASALAMHKLQQEYIVPMIGMVRPGAIAAARAPYRHHWNQCHCKERPVWKVFKGTEPGCNRGDKSLPSVCAPRGRGTDRRQDHRRHGIQIFAGV